MANGDDHEVREMPDQDAFDLVSDFQHDDDPVITLLYGELGNHDVLHLARAHISSIQIEGGNDD
jgi:hypothetical protein